MVKYSKWEMKQLYKCETIGTNIKRKHKILSALFWCCFKVNFSEILSNQKKKKVLDEKQINRDKFLLKRYKTQIPKNHQEQNSENMH